ncbi:MAG: hypothetical protein FD151_2052, partial [bacterium]
MKGLLYLVSIGLFLLQLTGDIFAYDDGDWQYWNTESIEGNISDRWKIKLEEEFRFG